MGVEVPGGDLGVPAGGGLQQGLVDKDVLVLRLYHVVPLSSHARDVTVDVHSLLVLHAFQHGIDDYEAAGAAHSGAVRHKAVSPLTKADHQSDKSNSATCGFTEQSDNRSLGSRVL